MMNTEYVALKDDATVADAMRVLKDHEELLETLNTLFLIDAEERLTGVVPLARLFLHEGATPLQTLAADTLIDAPVDEHQDRVTELFDKYNLLALPVVDENRKLAGVITADDIISVLRQK
jgi:Mg/Co/Ni transporter MgtE